MDNTLEQMIQSGEFSIDLNGHSFELRRIGTNNPISAYHQCEVLERLQSAAYRDGVLIGLAIAGLRTAAVPTSMRCCECGESLDFELSGKVLKAKSPCPCPDGVQMPFRVVIDVPSGRLAFADRFTFLAQPFEERNLRSQGMYSRKLQLEAWASIGFPSAGCGNSCPSIYRLGNRLIISSLKEDDAELPAGCVSVGYICTDYWSWHCGDFERLSEASETAGESLSTSAVIDVPAGRYEICVHSLHYDHNGKLFATIELLA